MFKKLGTCLLCAMLLFVQFTVMTPIKAEEVISKAPPVTTHTFTKSKTINGSTVKVQIKCNQRFDAFLNDGITYAEGSAKIVSVSGGGTARVMGTTSSGSTSSTSDDLLVVIVHVRLTKSGKTTDFDVNFAIRGTQSV